MTYILKTKIFELSLIVQKKVRVTSMNLEKREIETVRSISNQLKQLEKFLFSKPK